MVYVHGPENYDDGEDPKDIEKPEWIEPGYDSRRSGYRPDTRDPKTDDPFAFPTIEEAIEHGTDGMEEELFNNQIYDCSENKIQEDEEKEENGEESEYNGDYDDAAEDCIKELAAELKEYYDEAESEIQSVMRGEMPIFRAIDVVDFPKWLFNLKEAGTVPYRGAQQGVGLFWAWDKAKAIAYAQDKCDVAPGKGKVAVTLEAEVKDPFAVNVDDSLATNLYYMNDEKEVRMYPDKELFLKQVCTCKKCYPINRNVKT